MKIFVKNSFVVISTMIPYQMGNEYEMNDVDAKYYIAKGYASLVETEKTKEEKTETKPKKRKKVKED